MNRPIKRLVLTSFLLILTAIVYVGFGIWRTACRGVSEAYAAWDCALLLVEYMETHDGTWPGSWEDLLSAAQTLPNSDRMLRGHTADNVHKIAEFVRVDWDADPRKLAQATLAGEDVPFRVVTRLNGAPFSMVWEGAEPNTLVWEYLKSRAPDN
jgi:hypothetical protein